jgi:hypothetical protein
MNRRKKPKSVFLKLAFVGFLLCAYPTFVLGYTWFHVATANFPGGKHGPLDAYRHTLASAVVSYTLGQRVVYFVTLAMESQAKSSSVMDRHNNKLGSILGSQAKSFAEIQPAVFAMVQQGAMQATDSNQITWLPPSEWREGLLW